jgi:hypothetical protein
MNKVELTLNERRNAIGLPSVVRAVAQPTRKVSCMSCEKLVVETKVLCRACREDMGMR